MLSSRNFRGSKPGQRVARREPFLGLEVVAHLEGELLGRPALERRVASRSRRPPRARTPPEWSLPARRSRRSAARRCDGSPNRPEPAEAAEYRGRRGHPEHEPLPLDHESAIGPLVADREVPRRAVRDTDRRRELPGAPEEQRQVDAGVPVAALSRRCWPGSGSPRPNRSGREWSGSGTFTVMPATFLSNLSTMLTLFCQVKLPIRSGVPMLSLESRCEGVCSTESTTPPAPGKTRNDFGSVSRSLLMVSVGDQVMLLLTSIGFGLTAKRGQCHAHLVGVERLAPVHAERSSIPSRIAW